MKVSWENKTLDEISSDKKFAIVDGPFGTQLHASEYISEGVPVIRVVNLSYEGIFDDSKLVFISNKKANDLKRSEVVANDIIIAKTGATIGKSGLFPQKFERGIIASSCIKLSVAKDKGFYKYYLYLLSSEQGQKEILDGAGGSTRTTINVSPFKKISFKVPPLPQQRKIAQILSTVDAVLKKTEAAIAKYQQLKQGLMHDVFTRGIDVHTGQLRPKQTQAPELYKQSALGWIPKEWEVETLEKISSKIGDGIHATPKYVDSSQYYFINGNNLKEGKIIITDNTNNVSESEYKKHYKDLSEHTLLYSINGTIGNIAFYNNEKIVLGKSAAYICFKNSKLIAFIYYFLQSELVDKFYYLEQTGSTINNLSLASIRKTPIPTFNEAEQNIIAQKLQSIDQKIHTEQQALAKYQQLKAGLLQDLLTGRVAVRV